MTLSSLREKICETAYEITVFEKHSTEIKSFEVDYMNDDPQEMAEFLAGMEKYGKARVNHVCINSATGLLHIDAVYAGR